MIKSAVPQVPRHEALVQRYQPDALANLLVVHGYYDHIGLFGKLLQWGLENRCNVVALDLPGHGLSTGEPAVIDDFGDYSCAIRDVLQRVRMPDLPLFVIAQSMGCAALVDFARRYEWPFAATVLLAPLAVLLLSTLFVVPMAWVSYRYFEQPIRALYRRR